MWSKDMLNIKTSAVLLSMLFVGCATQEEVVIPQGPGSVQATVPPKMVASPTDPEARIWDNPSAFGPVPERLQKAGEILCGKLNTSTTSYVARGYHYKALDFNGNPMPGGGFLCLPTK